MSLEDQRVPSVCPVCGAVSLAPDGEQSALVAVCDVLVHKALEKLGSALRRNPRGRYNQLGGRPLYVAHTLWQPDDEMVDKILQGAWDVVPALLEVHGCCDVTPVQVKAMLDDYVHDLAVSGTPHTLEELFYRFRTRLGLPVYWRQNLPDLSLDDEGHVQIVVFHPEHSVHLDAGTPDPREGLPAAAQEPDTRPIDDPAPRALNTLPVLGQTEGARITRIPDRNSGALRQNNLGDVQHG